MGFFSFGFSNKDTAQNDCNWNQLTKIEQLEELSVLSFEKPIAIFKHSTRCGISRMALKNFETEMPADQTGIDLYYLDLLEHREISNAIAEKFGVWHESPQLILLKEGKSVYHSSHSDISAEALLAALNK